MSEDDLSIELGPASAGPTGAGPTVFVSARALADMTRHAAEDLNRERGGVLVGTAASSAEGVLVAVEGMIPALHTDASRGSVTFTHDTWEQINREKDRDWPDRRIVGWYHTHPGFGLFLSEYDRFIHRSFFDLPWQIALVVDPRAQQSGVFGWSGEELAGPAEFQVYGPAESAPAPVTSEAPSAPVPAPASASAPTPAPAARTATALWRWAVVALLICVLGLQALHRPSPPPAPATQMSAAPPAPDRELQALRDEVTQLRTASSAAPAAAPAPIVDTITVQRGDSLWRLAHHIWGDGNLWGALAVANGIEPDDLEPGMVLKIPRMIPEARDNDGAKP
jgi:proteasome lid subunit RPN8/RPN11